MAVKEPGTGSGGGAPVCLHTCVLVHVGSSVRTGVPATVRVHRELPLTDKAAHYVVILGKIHVFQAHLHFCTATSIGGAVYLFTKKSRI